MAWHILLCNKVGNFKSLLTVETNVLKRQHYCIKNQTWSILNWSRPHNNRQITILLLLFFALAHRDVYLLIHSRKTYNWWRPPKSPSYSCYFRTIIGKKLMFIYLYIYWLLLLTNASNYVPKSIFKINKLFYLFLFCICALFIYYYYSRINIEWSIKFIRESAEPFCCCVHLLRIHIRYIYLFFTY